MSYQQILPIKTSGDMLLQVIPQNEVQVDAT